MGELARSVGRRCALHRRNVALCAALIAAAAVVGGLPAVLLAFLAVLLILDSMIPLPGRPWSEADERFRRLVRRRRDAGLLRRLRGRTGERLDVLDDTVGWVPSELGIQPVAIDSIVGTVEALKARTFDCAFRPDRSSSEHWKRLWRARAGGAALPPVSLYRVDGRHYVRDGHHRVSIARDHGDATIDAEVVELRPARPG